ncbi:MAG: hypothetical protein CBB68_02935 [Rhodospirillaceae bacterium TMED8]|nr:phosphoribosylaminoimidazolecarboxamide formyltransferase [Magnetovibrio sp.]OUT52325.1 MAG: hypothetical protein CBB68_02935 [Rhodospirillaceae bacterium TMED8]|tara:strand:- start:797 stop:1141 length:345 start_codon:yes stop_codon:yes gene_type:complete
MNSDDKRDVLDSFDTRLSKARRKTLDPLKQPSAQKTEKGGSLGLAFRVSLEIVSAVGIGVGVGWFIDEWLGTKPWLMLLFIVLGGVAGMLNVYRLASGQGYAAGYSKDKGQQED